MKVKRNDPRHSTADSRAAANAWHAARAEHQQLTERIQKRGLAAVPATDHAAAEKRLTDTTAALAAHIPQRLHTYNADDWPGRPEAITYSQELHKRSQWTAAQLDWCIAHGVWSAEFSDLAAARPTPKRSRKAHTNG